LGAGNVDLDQRNPVVRIIAASTLQYESNDQEGWLRNGAQTEGNTAHERGYGNASDPWHLECREADRMPE
jgi:hypothetical protein